MKCRFGNSTNWIRIFTQKLSRQLMKLSRYGRAWRWSGAERWEWPCCSRWCPSASSTSCTNCATTKLWETLRESLKKLRLWIKISTSCLARPYPILFEDDHWLKSHRLATRFIGSQPLLTFSSALLSLSFLSFPSFYSPEWTFYLSEMLNPLFTNFHETNTTNWLILII